MQTNGGHRGDKGDGKQKEWGEDTDRILGNPDSHLVLSGNVQKEMQKEPLQKTLVKKHKEVGENSLFWGCGFVLKLLQ